MRILDKIKNKILEKSNSYNLYKKDNERLKRNNIFLKNQLKNQLSENFEDYGLNKFCVNSYYSPLIKAPFSKDLKKTINLMDDLSNYLILSNDNNYTPLISVIMPVYNRKDIIMNAINSVLNQSYANFELIIIDDGSTDGTSELLKELNNDKIKVICSDNNHGVSFSRNIGLSKANGEYIAYLDSDNMWDERYLEVCISSILKIKDADAIYSGIFKYKSYYNEPFEVLFGCFNKSLLYNRNYIDINSFFHKKTILEKVNGFDEKIKQAEDWDFILRVSKFFNIYSVPVILTHYYTECADNRITDTVEINRNIVRNKNEILSCKDVGDLNKEVTILIPILESYENLKKCLDSILSFKSKFNIIILDMDSKLDLCNFKFAENINIININDFNIEFIKSNYPLSDFLILSKDAILTDNSIENMQKYSYELPNCGLLVSQQLFKGNNIPNVSYADKDYYYDINIFSSNIIDIPLFFNGNFLKLKYAPFFCTYLKGEVFNCFTDFNYIENNEFMEYISEYINNILQLNIYYCSDIIVLNNNYDIEF